jgi:predicted Rossmann fold flavoprotein
VVLKDAWVSRVSGVTLPDIKITLFCDGTKTRSRLGKILFTHVGVSGPAILNMSSEIGDVLQEGVATLQLDLFPKEDEGALRKRLDAILADRSNRTLKNVLTEIIPKALVSIVLEQLDIDEETKGHSVSKEDRGRLASYLKHLPLQVQGLLGADKAVVTNGGVELSEIDFKTMSSRIVPNLFWSVTRWILIVPLEAIVCSCAGVPAMWLAVMHNRQTA